MKNRFKFNRGYFLAFLAFFAVELFIALFVRDRFIRPYVGDVLVIVLLYCLFRSFLPQKNRLLPVFLFLLGVSVELAQKFNLLGALGLQNIPPLQIVFGATYDIKDIACYFAGMLLLLLWERHGKTIHLQAKK